MLNLSKKMQKILALILVCCITLTGFSVSAIADPVNKILYSADNQEATDQTRTITSSAVNLVVTSQAALNLQETSDTQYLIYPIPREITYGSNGFSIGDKVNIIYGNDIDSYTKNHLETAISCLSNPPTVNESSQPVKDKINILVGVKGSGDAADTALKDIDTIMKVNSAGVSEDLDIFEKDNSANDSYIINVSEDGNIIILGKDTDAAFYGITTLKHIFSQMSKENTDVIRTFTICDYASVSYRGFIEGYYGIPWSHENRISLMEWGSEWKMNAYVFAPKDDLYHNLKWRELYPDDELAKIEELAETGNRTKNRYVYALHPFMNEGFNFNDFDNDFDIITKKFEQLYNVGVRQFAILADDAGSYRAEDLSKLLNNLNQWRKKYSDIYPLMFCPDVYNASWVRDEYLKLAQVNQLMNDDIEIFWTGQGVCGHASKAGAQSFVENINNVVNENADLTKQSRKPLMWLNWPVDDINMKRLIIGPGSNEGGTQYWNNDGIAVLNKEEADYFTGIISNPMQQAQLNKIPLFAVADFAWNDDDYDGQKSWKDSFQFVDQKAGNALYEMAKHLSDPDPNTHQMICGESEDIKELLEKFLQDFQSGKSISSQSEALIKEFDKIVNACNVLKESSQNDELIKEIESHRLSLKEISQSCIYFIRTAVALEQQKPNDVWANYSKATAELSKSKTHSIKTLDGFVYAESGSKRIIPFANTMAELLEDPVKSMIDPNYVPKAKVKFYKNNLGSWYSGTDADVIDGNSNTFAWTNAEVSTGSNFGVTYSIPVTITDFQVLTGDAPNNTGDALGRAILEYKLKDDTEYKQVPNGEFTAAGKWDFSDTPLENVVEMRVSSLENTSKWLVIREIGVIQEIESSTVIEGILFRSQDIVYGSNNEGLYGPDSKATDGDDSTYVHYGSGSNGNANIPEGAYVGLDFGKPVKFGKIRILQGNGKNNDRMSNAVLEYSLDGNEYKSIQTNLNQNEIILDLTENDITAQYIRLRNGSGCETWLALRTFEVLYPEKGTLAYTNSGDYSEMTCEIGYDNASLNVYSGKDITLNSNEYIGIKLPRIRNIIGITSSVSGDLIPTLELGVNEYEMNIVDAFNVSESNSINARYIRLKNNTSSQITFNLTELSVQSNEIYPPSLVESTMGSEANENNTITNVFDGNLNNEVILEGLQGKDRYAIIDIGQSININSLQLVVEDSEHDWVRYAKIEGSQSAQGPWTHIVNVGKQGANVDTPLISEESGWIHTISYCYSGSNPGDTPLNINARYLKITYLVEEENINKWTRISEICINSFITGNDYTPAYMPSENNPVFEGAKEVRGHSPSNITDGNIRTTYKPEIQEPGYILYRLSENIDKYKMINILQSPASLSEADILIREAGNSDFIKIGGLANSMNEFNISSFKTVAEIKIEWKDKIPEIHEFLISDKVPEPIDKTELNELIKKAEELNTAGYDEQILNIFNTTLKSAKDISGNNYIMQSSVEQAARELSEIIAVMMEDLPANKSVSLTDNETKINVKANSGILPEASVLFVKLINKEGLYDVAKAALESISNKFTLYDIIIKANSLVVQPKNGKATISIPVPSNYNTSLIELYEINGSGNLVGIQHMLDNGNIVFDTDHFNNGTAFIISEKIKEEPPVNNPVSLTDNATKINVKAEAGVLPNESILLVKSIVTGNLYDRAVNVFKNISKSFVLYDIIVEANLAAIQPKNGKATISIPVPANYNTSLLKLYEINENGNLFDISYTLSNGNAMFDTDHFSNGTAFVISEKSISNDGDNNNNSGGGSNGGSGGSSSKASETSNKINKDVKVELNEQTGETITTKKTKDGTIITKIESKDGSYTATAENSNGIKTETVYTAGGNTTANVTLPSDGDTIKVIIPLNKATQNTIAKIINSDATEEIIKKSIPSEDGIMVMINKSAKLVIVDNNRKFDDTQNHWAADSINFVTSRMLFQGTNQEEFSPDKPMTRAMIVSVLHRFEGEPESNYVNSFKDVSNDEYYSKAVAWAAENNIVAGIENEFNPNGNITREQLVSILYRYQGSPEVNGNIDSFSDKSAVSNWSNNAMIWAVENGIVSGTDKNKLNPTSNATRAEVSSILERFIKILFK